MSKARPDYVRSSLLLALLLVVSPATLADYLRGCLLLSLLFAVSPVTLAGTEVSKVRNDALPVGATFTATHRSVQRQTAKDRRSKTSLVRTE